MADEDITLDGKPLQSLRVADLKTALEQRNLPKSGPKQTLLKRLKGALMLENLQKSSSSHSGLQPNPQIGEEMSQNSFIKQYLAQQQELLQQRLEREAQQEAGANLAMEEEDDQSEDDLSFVSNKSTDKIRTEQTDEVESNPGFRKILTSPEVGSSLIQQGSFDVPRTRVQRAAVYQEHKEPPAPSPPRAVASLSVRVLGQPDRQEPHTVVPHASKNEGCTPSEPSPTYPVPLRSQAAADVYGQNDPDEDDDGSKDEEEWGPSAIKRAKEGPAQMPVNMSSGAARSKRKLQPPQHIPPPQAHPVAMQHPTPPPSPPPDLFPLPDTPKQSPPDGDADEDKKRGGHQSSDLPIALQRQNSGSSSHSSSPEPHMKHGIGPLSLLVHKMESEEHADTSARSDKPGSSRCALQSPEPKARDDRRVVEEDKAYKRVNRDAQEEQREDRLSEKMEISSSESTERQKGKNVSAHEQKIKDDDSAASSDSDSSSSSSHGDEPCSASQSKKFDHRKKAEDDTTMGLKKSEQKGLPPRREMSEPSAATMSEAEPESESTMVEQPTFAAANVNNDTHLEQDTTPKTFAARKISLASTKMSPATTEGAEQESGPAGGRKRRWGSSTAVTTKKPSISITTDSLKSLIPDIKVTQDAVVDLHPEELQLSGDEEKQDDNRNDLDKGLKIRRTVTQVVPGDGQENGQVNEGEEIPKTEEVKHYKTSKDKPKEYQPEETTDVQPEMEDRKVTPSDSLVRRSISQQKSGVSVTVDDPVHANRPLSPPRGKISNIIHVTNLVRPFTLGQLKDLLKQTGNLVEEGFWIDKIKSHCYVTYTTNEEAAATRAALHGVKWPQSNPKILNVDFCEQDELDFHKGILKPERQDNLPPQLPPQPARLPPLMPERDRERDRDHARDKERERERERTMGGVRDLCAEREREMLRRERTRGEREWDRDKIREFARPGEHERRSRSRERRRRERAKSKEKKSDRKEKADEPPAKMLDDLFLKTKAAPCIYWLPLTEEQVAQRILERAERQKERERKLKEQKEEEEKKREEEKKERLKGREKEVSVPGNNRAAGRGPDMDRGRDGDKRRDSGHRPRRPSVDAGNGRRSRSHSNPRDRRR